MEILSLLNSQLSFVEQLCLVTLFGLIIGSFSSLVSHRLASKEPITFARSKCLSCNVPLKIKNLIPLFSWILQKGKCSNCNSKISIRYPLIELSFAVTFIVIYFALGSEINAKLVLYCLIAGTLIVMSIVDLEHYFIPDVTQYFLAFLVIILRIMEDGVSGATMNIGAAFLYVGFGILLVMFFHFSAGIEALGVDDIKFFFIAGLLLGTKGFLLFMLLSGLLGAVFGTIWQRIKREATFPFAPAICVSLFVSMLYGKKINVIETIGSLIF
ncbi:MAG: A24 family peptidase [Rickettsiales bacterium]|nr:A24 family peptidase [Rickettsiales bacterium]